MSEINLSIGYGKWLLVSAALNLFLLGYLSAQLPFLNDPPHGFGPPPFAGPGHHGPTPFLFRDAVSPEEIQAHFDKIHLIRQEIIDALLADKPPTEAQLTRLLDQTEKEMMHLQDKAQAAAVHRMLTMTREERIAFAHTLEADEMR